MGSMKRKCEICQVEYDPSEAYSFARFKYCSEKCEEKGEIEARAQATGIHMYMCIKPLPITIWGANNEQVVPVEESTKWQRNDEQNKQLNQVHLVNTSGRADEPLGWIEITEQALKEHFMKI